MRSYDTKYGQLRGIVSYHLHPNGSLKECMLKEKVELNTPFGKLVPQYEYVEIRRRHIKSVAFFPDGCLKSISLNNQTEIKTPVGIIPAELVTFYESGSINRVFPLNGQISAYWGEDEEYRLAREYELKFSFGSFKIKIIGIYFYDNGAVKGVTLWPGETIQIETPAGVHTVKTGISLYPDGKIKSFEPASPVIVTSPIGSILAFDSNLPLIYRDNHSIAFNENGDLISLITSSNKIKVITQGGEIYEYIPAYSPSSGNGKLYPEPFKIEFFEDKVRLKGRDIYEMGKCSFEVEPYSIPAAMKCGIECSNCSQCLPML